MGKIYEAMERAQRERTKEEGRTPIPPADDTPENDKPLELFKEMAVLYQHIDALLDGSPKKVIQFIAAREGEGTSTIVREFARTSATILGKTVLLFDADKPNFHTDSFTGGNSGDDGGGDPANPGAIVKSAPEGAPESAAVCLIPQNSHFIQKQFYSPAIEDFWENLRKRFDLVLIDSPPLANSPDGIAISRRVDGVVLILEAEKTRWPVAENLRDQILKSGGRILGVVFNKRRMYIPKIIYKWI